MIQGSATFNRPYRRLPLTWPLTPRRLEPIVRHYGHLSSKWTCHPTYASQSRNPISSGHFTASLNATHAARTFLSVSSEVTVPPARRSAPGPVAVSHSGCHLVLFGRGCDGRQHGHGRQVIGRSGQPDCRSPLTATGQKRTSRAHKKQTPARGRGRCDRAADTQFALRRRVRPNPARPRPSSANVPGSGTVLPPPPPTALATATVPVPLWKLAGLG